MVSSKDITSVIISRVEGNSFLMFNAHTSTYLFLRGCTDNCPFGLTLHTILLSKGSQVVSTFVESKSQQALIDRTTSQVWIVATIKTTKQVVAVAAATTRTVKMPRNRMLPFAPVVTGAVPVKPNAMAENLAEIVQPSTWRNTNWQGRYKYTCSAS